MADWKTDKRWADRFLDEIKAILGQKLIAEPPIEEDAEHNTDLMVLRLDTVRVGCRVRTHKYLHKYGSEFTIRAGRPNGRKTELTKIIEGWGDYFFYGISDPSETQLCQWGLGDLRVFRIWYMRELATLDRGCVPGIEKNNHDKSSSFAVFRWRQLPPEFTFAASWLDR